MTSRTLALGLLAVLTISDAALAQRRGGGGRGGGFRGGGGGFRGGGGGFSRAAARPSVSSRPAMSRPSAPSRPSISAPSRANISSPIAGNRPTTPAAGNRPNISQPGNVAGNRPNAGNRPSQLPANRPNRGGNRINNGDINIGNGNNGGWDDDWGCCHGYGAAWAAGAVTGAAVNSMYNDAYIYTLPANCVVSTINGVVYNNCGGVWYVQQFVGDDPAYVVTSPPQ